MNISINGESILLDSANCYYIIDALYLNSIREELTAIKPESIEEEIREKVFPHSDAPFAIADFIQSSSKLEVIDVHRIRKVSDEQLSSRCFATDTGLIIFCNKSIFLDFLQIFNYYDLVNAMNGPINTSYWQTLVSRFEDYSCGLVLSPGINKGFDFDGSGLYEFK